MTTKVKPTYPTYEKYKDTGIPWLGKIPEHWEVRKMKYIFDLILTGTTPSTNNKKFFDGSINWFKPEDLNTEILTKSKQKLSQYAVNRGEVKVFPKDSILIVGIGSVGKTAYLTIPATFNQQITGFHSRKNYNKFYFFLFQSFSDIMLRLANYTILPILNNEFFKSLLVPLPPLSEQEAIAKFLDKKTEEINRIISLRQRQIDLLKERKQIIIQRTVTRGLAPDVPLKDTGIPWLGKIPKHWEVRKLRSLLFEVSIKNKPNLPLLSITREQGVIIRDITNKDENHNFIPDDLSNYKVIEKGQFGINKMKAWQGSYGVSNYTGIVSPAYYVFNLSNIVLSDFFHIAIRSNFYINFFAAASEGVRIGQWDLSKDKMKEIPFLIPPLSEQKEIVAYIEQETGKIDQTIGLINREIELLKEYKQTLINHAVTGKIKVV